VSKLISERIHTFFSNTVLYNKAIESNFFKRSGGKISPKEFIDVVLHCVATPGYLSLNQSSIEYSDQRPKSISKQAIDKRFTNSAVDFLRLLVEEALSTQLSEELNILFLEKFSNLRIKDGTRFDLPKQLSDHFKGFGGICTSDAAICIQYEFDLKTLKFTYFNLTSANVPDVTEAVQESEEISHGELIVRDLGYFKINSFQYIDQQGAFYISRANTNVSFEKENQEICFKTLYQHMKQTNQRMIRMVATMGKVNPIQTTLVIELVSEEIYQNRIVSQNKTAKRKGKSISDNARIRARFTLMITNIPIEAIPTEQLYTLYRLRWQIELMFKHWKSKLGIEKVQKMKYERFKCLIYAKLLYIILTLEIVSVARKLHYQLTKKILSIDKSLKTIFYQKLILNLSRTVSKGLMTNQIKKLFQNLSSKHWQEKRNNRVNFEDIFCLFI
jgi:hypothetical protein